MIGARWTARKRPELTRPNDRGQTSQCSSHGTGSVPQAGWPAGLVPPGTTTHDEPPARHPRRGMHELQPNQDTCGPRVERVVPCGEHALQREDVGGRGVPVAKSAVAPPGPIPNPVVTRRSAGEYCRGDPVGGEAAAGTPRPQSSVPLRCIVLEPRRRKAAWVFCYFSSFHFLRYLFEAWRFDGQGSRHVESCQRAHQGRAGQRQE